MYAQQLLQRLLHSIAMLAELVCLILKMPKEGAHSWTQTAAGGPHAAGSTR